MDKIDQEILTQLTKKPKKPFLKIAQEIGISPITVQNRYEKMKKEGIIFGTSMMIDLSKIGFQGKAFLFITSSTNCKYRMTTQTLSKIQNVFLIAEIVGAFDVLVMLTFRDIAEIKETVDQIRAQPCVEKVETALTNDTIYPVKEDFTDIQLFGPENAEIS